MNDCPKAELRDRLPDLLHERLDAFARAAVVAHLEECSNCREELELLRGLRLVMMRGVSVQIDVTRIVRALPAPTSVAPRIAPTNRLRRFSDWRVAAAITMLLAAGTSVGAYLHTSGRPVVVDTTIARLSVAPPVGDSGTPVYQVAQSELYVGGGLTDLSDDELQSLASDIENFDGLPAADPDAGLPVPLRAPEGL